MNDVQAYVDRFDSFDTEVVTWRGRVLTNIMEHLPGVRFGFRLRESDRLEGWTTVSLYTYAAFASTDHEAAEALFVEKARQHATVTHSSEVDDPDFHAQDVYMLTDLSQNVHNISSHDEFYGTYLAFEEGGQPSGFGHVDIPYIESDRWAVLTTFFFVPTSVVEVIGSEPGLEHFLGLLLSSGHEAVFTDGMEVFLSAYVDYLVDGRPPYAGIGSGTPDGDKAPPTWVLVMDDDAMPSKIITRFGPEERPDLPQQVLDQWDNVLWPKKSIPMPVDGDTSVSKDHLRSATMWRSNGRDYAVQSFDTRVFRDENRMVPISSKTLPWPRDHRRYENIQTLGEFLETIKKRKVQTGEDPSVALFIPDDDVWDEEEAYAENLEHAGEAEHVLFFTPALRRARSEGGFDDDNASFVRWLVGTVLLEAVKVMPPEYRLPGNDHRAMQVLIEQGLSVMPFSSKDWEENGEEYMANAEALWNSGEVSDVMEEWVEDARQQVGSRYSQTLDALLTVLHDLKTGMYYPFYKQRAIERGAGPADADLWAEDLQRKMWEVVGDEFNHPFFVASHMNELIEHTAFTRIPDDFVLMPQDLYRPKGFVYFERPLLVSREVTGDEDFGDYPLYARALQWYIQKAPEAAVPSVIMHWYIHRHDTAYLDPDAGLYEVLTDPRNRTRTPMFMELMEGAWTFSRAVPIGSDADASKVVLTIWKLLGQVIGRPVGVPAQRQARKRAEREGMDGDVHVMYLRRTVPRNVLRKQETDGNSDESFYKHQHIVPPHMQRYWVGPRGQQHMEWRMKEAYVRGPADAPLLITENIGVLKR